MYCEFSKSYTISKYRLPHIFNLKELLKVDTSALHMINSFQSPKAQIKKSLQFSLCMLWAVVKTLRPAPVKVGQI